MIALVVYRFNTIKDDIDLKPQIRDRSMQNYYREVIF